MSSRNRPSLQPRLTFSGRQRALAKKLLDEGLSNVEIAARISADLCPDERPRSAKSISKLRASLRLARPPKPLSPRQIAEIEHGFAEGLTDSAIARGVNAGHVEDERRVLVSVVWHRRAKGGIPQPAAATPQKPAPAVPQRRPSAREEAMATTFAGVRFEDDPRAARPEPRFRQLPPAAVASGSSLDF